VTQERLGFGSPETETSATEATEVADAAGHSVSTSRPIPVRLSLRDNLRAHRRAWMAIRGVREIIVIGATYALYDITRYLIAGAHAAAFSHAHSILRFEQRLHLDPEHAVNKLFSAHIALGLPADYIYATLHYIVTPAVLIWLWRRHPASYSPARTVLVATTLIGLIGFSLVPVAPPRLIGGFIDTMAKFSHYGWWGDAGSAPRGFGHDTNQYAAMPSLHVGWALWSGWQLIRHGRSRVTRILGALYPLVLAVVVIGTANHYLLDVVAGVAVVVVGAIFAQGWTSITDRIWPDYSLPAPPAGGAGRSADAAGASGATGASSPTGATGAAGLNAAPNPPAASA
jgi:PAP2 superfamily